MFSQRLQKEIIIIYVFTIESRPRQDYAIVMIFAVAVFVVIVVSAVVVFLNYYYGFCRLGNNKITRFKMTACLFIILCLHTAENDIDLNPTKYAPCYEKLNHQKNWQ